MTVWQGTCGWTGQQLGEDTTQGKRAEKPLVLYKKLWPAVEVNSSNYAIPSIATVQSWFDTVRAPKQFRFTFKAYGLFTAKRAQTNTLPEEVRQLLTPEQRTSRTVSWDEMPSRAKNRIWELFNEVIGVAYSRTDTRFPSVVCLFQFPLQFVPSERNLAHVEFCRKKLDARCAMAAEFRNRSWFVDVPENVEKRIERLRSRSIAVVSADELEHETFPDRVVKGDDGEVLSHNVLPIAEHVTSKEFHYVRIHRRHGFENRRLSEGEIARWAGFIKRLANELDDGASIFVFWGTEHANAPLNNCKNLAAALAGTDGIEMAEAPSSRGDAGGIKRYFPFMGIT